MDAAALGDDIPNLINCECYERLVRWKYGLERVFDDVRTQEDWKGAKPKTNWALLPEYSPSHRLHAEPRAPAADTQVTNNLQTKALFKKYLDKAGVTTGADGG